MEPQPQRPPSLTRRPGSTEYEWQQEQARHARMMEKYTQDVQLWQTNNQRRQRGLPPIRPHDPYARPPIMGDDVWFGGDYAQGAGGPYRRQGPQVSARGGYGGPPQMMEPTPEMEHDQIMMGLPSRLSMGPPRFRPPMMSTQGVELDQDGNVLMGRGGYQRPAYPYPPPPPMMNQEQMMGNPFDMGPGAYPQPPMRGYAPPLHPRFLGAMMGATMGGMDESFGG